MNILIVIEVSGQPSLFLFNFIGISNYIHGCSNQISFSWMPLWTNHSQLSILHEYFSGPEKPKFDEHSDFPFCLNSFLFLNTSYFPLMKEPNNSLPIVGTVLAEFSPIFGHALGNLFGPKCQKPLLVLIVRDLQLTFCNNYRLSLITMVPMNNVPPSAVLFSFTSWSILLLPSQIW